ncbi:MAG: hypothetical protein EOP49_02590 [Sphingobacteriales bacterium]|nr:MAG: hypothetical protein EOP49_02590 [Sphingobacteriales bacterium]
MSSSIDHRSILRILLGILFLGGTTAESVAQTYTETFGQNRIQERKFEWRFFDTEHFRVYHYDAAGRQLARYVAEQAEKDIRVIEQKMSGKFPKRFNIILYNNYDEYLQTNVGKKFESQIQDVPAGTVDLVGDRLVIYFTGVHTDVRRQLRAGMSRVVMERLLFGESFREMVKNAVLLNLPQWTVNGFIAYLVDGWDAESETHWKNMLQAHPNYGFYELAEKDPELAGKAFWKYVSEKYGENNVRNLLYAMQLKSSLAQGITMTLGQSVKQTYDSVKAFYTQTYSRDAFVQEHPDSGQAAILEIDVPKDNTQIRSIRVSPKGFNVAYVTWKEGEFKVYLQHTEGDEKRSVIVEGGNKDYNALPDPDYPLLAWSNNGYKLAVLYKQGKRTRLRIYNSLKAKIEEYIVPANRFDRVQGMSFMEDDDKLVFSAIKKSQTDLYEFRIRGSRITPITNDPWDDAQPWFISGGSRRGVLFLSNRPQPNLKVPIQVNELPTGPMNAYFYDTKTQRSELLRISSNIRGNISQPIQYGSEHFAYLYDNNGIVNKYVVLFGRDVNNMDSAYSVPVTNYSQSIISHQYNPSSNQVADVIQVGDKYKVYFKPLVIPGDSLPPKELKPTTLSVANEVNTTPVVSPNTVVDVTKQTGGYILETGDVFESEFGAETPAADSANIYVNSRAQALSQLGGLADGDPVFESADPDVDSILVDSTYVKMRAQPYRHSFRPDFFSVKLDNSVLFNKYQPADLLGGAPGNQSLGGMLSLSLNDVLENHRFTGGYRLPINFAGSTYFLQYENFARKIDWGVLYVRTSNTYQYEVEYGPNFRNLQTGKVVSNLLQGSMTYPLDKRRSLRFHMAFRQDKLTFMGKDTLSLFYEMADQNKYWTMSRAEYIYDNSISPALNIHYGLRYKIYGEYFYKLSQANGGFFNIGMDFRYYKKLYKNIISATRLAYAHSLGNMAVNYMMGGVDNWLMPKVAALRPPPSSNFAFQTLANNMRGYEQSSRIGNSFGVINAEVRLPLVTTFVRKPLQSAFLKNLQLVPFLDIGNAWNGWVPGGEQLENGYVYGNVPVVVTIPPPSLSTAIGYGTGIRTMLFGYFMRLDAAWNIEGRRTPLWHFSIGTDF